MPVSFAQAALWGYQGYEALARGVVTPRDDNKIILFVTLEKNASMEQYQDELLDGLLHWEGPRDHFAEDRIVSSDHTADEIHLFSREKQVENFVYQSQLKLQSCERNGDRPSKFVFRVNPTD